MTAREVTQNLVSVIRDKGQEVCTMVVSFLLLLGSTDCRISVVVLRTFCLLSDAFKQNI